jgi:hypothetical protein
MMTKRYFYSDPLAAAYMAREHGVNFIQDFSVSVIVDAKFDDTLQIGYSGGTVSTKSDCPPYCIHPDSLPIFEPRKGDVMLQPSGRPFLSTGRKVTTAVHGNQIIQRDNKPFFWPELDSENSY